MHYEMLKHSGELPIIGVNTFIDPKTMQSDYVPPKIEMARASREEKDQQLHSLDAFKERHSDQSGPALAKLKQTALSGKNIFAELMEASRVCSLYQMTEALYHVGGEYRRNL